MSDFLSEADQVRAEALRELRSMLEGVLVQYHFRSGLELDLISAIACEAVAEIYGRHRVDQHKAAATLRWIADQMEQSPTSDPIDDEYPEC